MLKSNKLAKKDFLSSLDMSTEEVNHTIELAKNLKNNDKIEVVHFIGGG